jgi:antitoxin CptB
MSMKLEEIEKKRKRLIFRSWHRGTKEMDLLMGTFADRNVHDMSADEIEQYDEMLNCSDPDLYNWISGRETPPANQMSAVLEKFLAHKFTEA